MIGLLLRSQMDGSKNDDRLNKERASNDMAPIFEISVSSTETDRHCDGVVKSLAMAGLDARVTPNTSVHFGKTEHGCAIRIPSDKADKKQHARTIWNAIKAAGNYECAHLRIDGTFSGCIFNYMDADEKCPTNLRMRQQQQKQEQLTPPTIPPPRRPWAETLATIKNRS